MNLLKNINNIKKNFLEKEKENKENILESYIKKKMDLNYDYYKNIHIKKIKKEYLNEFFNLQKNEIENQYKKYIETIKSESESEIQDLDNNFNNILFLYIDNDYNYDEIQIIINNKENESKEIKNKFKNKEKEIEEIKNDLINDFKNKTNVRKFGNELLNKYKIIIDEHITKFKESIEKLFMELSSGLEIHYENLINLNKELIKNKEDFKKSYKNKIEKNINQNYYYILSECTNLNSNFNNFCVKIEKENKNKIRNENEKYNKIYDKKLKNIENLFTKNNNQIEEINKKFNQELYSSIQNSFLPQNKKYKLKEETKNNNNNNNDDDSTIYNDEEINEESPNLQNKLKVNKNKYTFINNEESKEINNNYINQRNQNNQSVKKDFNKTYQNKKFFNQENEKSNKNENIIYSDKGLLNLGNTCFMNSVLQCIRHIEPIVDAIFKNSENFSEDTIIYQLNNLLKKLNSNKYNFGPYEFRNTLCKYKSKYIEKKQFDSTEFLLILFDLINKEFLKEKKIHNYHNNKDNNIEQTDILEKFKIEKNNYFEINNSPLNRIIVGFLCNETIYSCNHDYDIDFENFNILDLPILSKNKKELKSLYECLDNFFLDTIEEEECEYCHNEIDVQNTIKLFYLPTILIINFKRVLQNKHLNFNIIYPEYLDMRKYIKINNPNFKHSCKYELKALIKHQGNAFGGHKIAVCRDYVNNNKWYEYSDADVNEIRNKNEIFTNEAFLLFYQRINNDCYEFSGKKNFLSKSVLNY